MQSGTRGALLALSLGFTVPASAGAGVLTRPVWTFATYIGRAHFDPTYEVKGGIPIGGRLGFTFLGRFGLEGNFGKTFGESGRVPNREYPIDQYGLDLTADLLPDSWINPYLFAGWAQLSLDESDELVLHMNGMEAGGGVKVRLVRDPVARTDLRLDFRGIRVKNGDTLDGAGSMRGHLFVTVGFMMSLAGREPNPDRDGDGVLDATDVCPGTPIGARVDGRGCPVDTDLDGVPDGIDLCEGTPGDVRVDELGCALDTDGDGVFDGRDHCPETPPRVLTDADGCPLPARAATVEADLADAGFVTLGGTNFAEGSAELGGEGRALLAEMGRVLAAGPDSRIEITGFAGASEGGAAPAELAQLRAQAVRDQLIAGNPALSGDRIDVRGRVDTGPSAPPGAPERAAARRVEIRITNPGAERSPR